MDSSIHHGTFHIWGHAGGTPWYLSTSLACETHSCRCVYRSLGLIVMQGPQGTPHFLLHLLLQTASRLVRGCTLDLLVCVSWQVCAF